MKDCQTKCEKYHGLPLAFSSFDEIYTNPAKFNEEGQLVVQPYEYQTECDLSERNLCKAKVMLDYIKNKDYAFVCYAGDGGNENGALY